MITDYWVSIIDLGKNFDHFTVNHKRNFLNPMDPSVHTQNIERFWRTLKTFLKNYSSQQFKHTNILNCLYEQMFKKIDETKKFHFFICIINDLIKSDSSLDNLIN